MSNIDQRALREAAGLFISGEGEHWWDEKQLTHEDGLGLSEADGKFIAAAKPAVVLALLDELEAAEKKTFEMPTFDGYVPHVARELQAAFRIACDNAGINVAAGTDEGNRT